MALRFGDLRLLVTDYPRAFRFYREGLELELTWGDETTGYASFRMGDGSLVLYDRKEMAAACGTSPEPTPVGLPDSFVLSFVTDDLDARCTVLKAKGVTFVAEPYDQKDWGYRIAHLRDPEGNLIELYTPLPRE